MFTHNRVKGMLVAVMIIAVGVACQAVVAGEWVNNSHSDRINPYSFGESESVEMVDAIDRDYPPTTAGTINDPRLQDPMVKSVDLVDTVDKNYPPNTSGARQDTRYQLDPDTMSSDDIVDTIDRLDAGQPIP